MSYELELRETSRDARIAIAGEIIYVFLGYAITLLIAREAGPGALGIYAISLVILNMGEICCTLGLGQACLRYIPLYVRSSQAELVKGIVHFSSWTSGLSAAVIGAAMFGLASILAEHLFKELVLSDALRVIALALSLFAVQGVWSYALQGFKAIKYKVFVEKILEPGTRLVAVSLFFLFGMKLLGGILAILVGVLISTAATFRFLKGRMAYIPEGAPARYERRSWLFYSVPLLFQSLAVFLQPSLPLLLIQHFEDSTQVGIFSAALKVSSMISLPLLGLNTVSAPRISELYGGGEIEKLRSLYGTLTAWTISAGLLPFMLAFFFAAPIMQIFGPEFEVSSSVLKLLAVGQLATAASGLAGCVLVMTGRSGLSLANSLLSTCASLVLSLLLIPPFGIQGAAIASAATVAGTGIIGLVEVFCLLRIQPYGRESLKPLAAGGILTLGALWLSAQGTSFAQMLLLVPAYLGLFWLASPRAAKERMRNLLTVAIRARTEPARKEGDHASP